MKVLKLCLAILFLLALNTIHAQVPANTELQELLKDKKNFSEVWGIVTRYYAEKNAARNPKLFSEFKKWNRWAWWESKHLDEQGNLINSNKRIFTEIQRIKNNTTRTNGTESNSGQWSLLGPQNLTSGIARVDRLAFDPTNPAIIYAGTPSAGLWKTTDGGSNWFPLHGFAPS
jgi:hypothetical protein